MDKDSVLLDMLRRLRDSVMHNPGAHEDGHKVRSDYQCSTCGGLLDADLLYDAYYCPNCDHWDELICGDSACAFCRGRPERPSQRGQDSSAPP